MSKLLAFDTNATDGNIVVHAEDSSTSLLVRSKKLRVLVVDDNSDAADILPALRQISGHATRIANNGHRALKLADDFRLDVTLLDIGLPTPF